MALTTVPASLSATALTLTTAAQPNITSVGTLTGLTVSGNIAGTLTTAAQTNITSLGTLTGLTVGGTISIGDWTNAINIGASNDLQLYHVGGNSHIKSDTGQLIIRTDALRVLNNANSEQILHGDADGAVTLYYDNAAKLATASGGVTVTGTLTATTLAGTLSTAAQTNITSVGTLTGLTSSGSIQTTGASTYFISNSSSSGDYIRIYAGSGTGKWDIYGNGANLRFSDNDGAGGVYFDREIGIRNAPDSNYALKLLQNQSLTHGGYFQINGGTATGLEINATSGSFSGTALYVRESSVTTGGYLARFANSAGDKVTIATDGTATFGGRINFAEHIIGSANGGYIQFRGTGNRYWVIGSTGGNTVPTTASATLGFHHYDGSSWTQNRFNITAGGNVGIGTSNPNALLDVGGGNIADPTIRIDSASGGDPTLIFDASQANRSARIKFYDNGSNVGGFIDYLHNGDKMNFGAGSSATATMTVGDGKVGIGTSSPGALLDLETAGNTADGTYYSTLTINNTGSSTYSRLRFDRSGSARWGVGLRSDDKFQICKLWNGASDDTFVITGDGRVGIATNAPSKLLHVVGNDNQVVIDGTSSTANSGLFFAEQGTDKWEVYHRGADDSFRIYNYATSSPNLLITYAGRLQLDKYSIKFHGTAQGKHEIRTGGRTGTGTYTLFTNGSSVTQSAGIVEVWGIYGTPSGASYRLYVISGNRSIATAVAHTQTNSVPTPVLSWSGANLQITNSNGSLYYHVRVTLHEIGNGWAATWGNFPGMG